TGGEVLETSPPGARVVPTGTGQQRVPAFYMSQQQLQMLQFLQQNSANLTPQQQASIIYIINLGIFINPFKSDDEL
ncbi:hypothetical protein L9F63_025328, partial [Diploptera punctata]